MELSQIKSILHQTEVGELFTDGMGCSEPIVTKKERKTIDNFFVYLANKKAHTISSPIARIGLHADSCTIEYLISCEEEPFSLSSKDTLRVNYPTFSAQDYENYALLYAKVRNMAFKTGCTKTEKQIVMDYMVARQKIIAPEMMKFYEEMAPSFFEWVEKEIL